MDHDPRFASSNGEPVTSHLSGTTVPHRGGRSTLPACYRDIAAWPPFDDSVLSVKDRTRFAQLRDAVVLYMNGSAVKDVLRVAGVSEGRFYEIFNRIFDTADDGKMLGLRALARGKHVRAHVRRKEFTRQEQASSGFSGMFKKLLTDHPGIRSELVTYLCGHGLKGLQPNRLLSRRIHRKFLAICEAQGIANTEYPFNTVERARRALRRWIDVEYMPQYAQRFMLREGGSEAEGLLAYGNGEGQASRELGGYGTLTIDANAVDVHATYEIPAPDGSFDEIELPRFQLLRAIHACGANLAQRTVYAAQVSAEDVAILLWHAVNGSPPVHEVIPGLVPVVGAGFPADVIPRLRFAMPTVVLLDNALAHLADHVQHVVNHLFGARVLLGPPRTPHERAQIESKFGLQARRVLHQLPSTSGSGPKDPLRRASAVSPEGRIRADELEHVLRVYVQNENMLPTAASRNIAPLLRLQRLLDSGALKPEYLPDNYRKPYFFNKPMRVLVKADMRNGRRPFINYLYQKYTSSKLGRRFDLKAQAMYVRADFENIQTIELFHLNGDHFDTLRAIGAWGRVPHDVRIRKLFGKLKREGELGERADDAPLELLFEHLRRRAACDKRAALQLTYLVNYLQRMRYGLSPEMQEEYRRWVALETAAKSADVIPIASIQPSNQESRTKAISDLDPRASSLVEVAVAPSEPRPQKWLMQRRNYRL